MNPKQITNVVVMVEPLYFGFNPETAQTNVFSHAPNDSKVDVQKKALEEFNRMKELLREKGITVLVLQSLKDKITPDSVFPNNWFSHHHDGKLIIYPMLTPNRRAERQITQLETLLKEAKIPISEEIDLSSDENDGYILEGTGSLVLDRVHKVAFSMSSPRTSKVEFDKWCSLTGYEGIFFNAYDEKDFPIYHTNVTMNIGRNFVVSCLESVKNVSEKQLVENKLKGLGKEIISVSIKQMYQFCGNILELESNTGGSKIIMSETAFKGFIPEQINILQKYGEIVRVSIDTIERVGGGSARCMLAEVFKD